MKERDILLFSLGVIVFVVGISFAGTNPSIRKLAPVERLPFLDNPDPLAVRSTISSSKDSVRSLFFVDSHGQQHHMVFDPMGDGVIDTLKWHVGGPYDYNDYLGSYDTTFIWFYPVAECSLLEVWGNFHDQATVSSQKISIAGLCYEEQGDACVDTCCPYWISVSEDESDTFAISLTDNLLPSALSWNVAGGDQWSKMDFTLYPPGYVLALPADTAFMVILRAAGGAGGGTPHINWDDCDGFTRDCGGGPRCAHWHFTLQHTTHASRYCPGVYCSRHYYVYYHTDPWSYPELLVKAVVEYQSVPPFIDSLTQVMDSYHLDGDFEIEAGMSDLDGEVTEATLSFTVRNSGDTTGLARAITPHPPTVFIGTATISGSFSHLDTIDYWVNCEDDDGKAGIWRGQGDAVKSFVFQEPNLKADIFLVNDMGGNRDMYYRALLDSLGYQYEYWNVTKSHGLDATILGYGNWNTAILFGWGCGTLPGKDYTGDMWANFLDQGTSDITRNILYVDQDYFCVHDGDYPGGCAFEGELYEGEFLYDYFGVGWAKSDPVDQDTLFIGLDGQIVGKYVDSLFVLNTDNVGITPWTDYTKANDQALDIFRSDSAVYGGDSCGIRYDGGIFKTVFLPFPFEAVCDKDIATEKPILTDQALTVMDSILSWFGTKDSLEGIWEIPSGGELPQVFTLSQNYPNPLNPHTQIKYALPRNCWARLEVYNILGQKVATLVDGEQKAGYKIVKWDAGSFTSGIYLYRLQAGGFVQARKMLLLK